jgi:polyisoprenoid-binding protein YceI
MSGFVVDPARSLLTVNARSNVHPIRYGAPLAGRIDAETIADGFDLDAPIIARLEVALGELHAGDPLHDAELRRRLDLRRFPTAAAAVADVVHLDADEYRLGGTLSLLGVTRTLSGTATVTLDAGELRAAGSVDLDIREFGIKPPRLLLLRVEPIVEVAIRLYAQTAG